jgi:hypothetical protein
MRIKYISFLIVTAILSATGCKKGYLDVNEVNPNQTENPPIN